MAVFVRGFYLFVVVPIFAVPMLLLTAERVARARSSVDCGTGSDTFWRPRPYAVAISTALVLGVMMTTTPFWIIAHNRLPLDIWKYSWITTGLLLGLPGGVALARMVTSRPRAGVPALLTYVARGLGQMFGRRVNVHFRSGAI